MDAGGWGLEGCTAVVKASRSKLRIHFKGCETLVTCRREKLTTVENQHILRKRPMATAKTMGKKANSGPEVYGKKNRNGSKTCRKCSLFFIWEMLINNGTRIPFSLMKGAQVET